jgi:hypothetical protein
MGIGWRYDDPGEQALNDPYHGTGSPAHNMPTDNRWLIFSADRRRTKQIVPSMFPLEANEKMVFYDSFAKMVTYSPWNGTLSRYAGGKEIRHAGYKIVSHGVLALTSTRVRFSGVSQPYAISINLNNTDGTAFPFEDILVLKKRGQQDKAYFAVSFPKTWTYLMDHLIL